MKLGRKRLSLLIALLGCVSAPAMADQRGEASWYGPFHEGRKMANQRPFHMMQPTVAHRTLPLGTLVLIRNVRNGLTAQAVVTDRGPYVRGRVLDVSKVVATQLQMLYRGTAVVEIVVIGHRA